MLVQNLLHNGNTRYVYSTLAGHCELQKNYILGVYPHGGEIKYMYVYIYIYMCVCVYSFKTKNLRQNLWKLMYAISFTYIFWSEKLQCMNWYRLFVQIYTLALKVLLCCFSSVLLFATLWTVVHQAPLSMGFSRQEYWSRLPCPPPGDLPKPGI